MPEERKPQIKTGLKFKDKNKDRARDDRPDKPSRDRSRSPDRFRDRDRNRDRERDRDRDRDRNRDYNRERDYERDRDRDRGQHRDNQALRDPRDRRDRRDIDRRVHREKDSSHLSNDRGPAPDKPSKDGLNAKPAQDKPKTKAPAAPSGPQEAMIQVTVNDRLGSKAKVACFASDSVKVFKAIVAAQIGRKPHEIMLKRQGERPFKDQLTLLDYGVSNGVQLDLELDTGD